MPTVYTHYSDNYIKKIHNNHMITHIWDYYTSKVVSAHITPWITYIHAKTNDNLPARAKANDHVF